MPFPRRTDEELLAHVVETIRENSSYAPNGCINWVGAKNSHGYGRITIGHAKSVSAHRAAYAIRNGLGFQFEGVICHRCDNRACINSEHLFLGTVADNNRDMLEKGRSARGERMGRSNLTEAKILAIRSDPRSTYKIAVAYGVTQSSIWAIKKRKNWKHVI